MAQWSMFLGGHRDGDEGRGNIVGLVAAMILLPIAALLIQLAISRSRGYGADDTGADVSRDPLAVNPSVSSLFIVQPLLPGSFTRLFSTHPPIEARIVRLQRLAGAELPAL